MNRYRVLALFAVSLSAACSGKGDAAQTKSDTAANVAQPALRVSVAGIEARKMPRLLTLTGSIVADRQSDIAANVAGRIVSAPIERGQRVSQGQVIAIVDARSAGFSATAASAQHKVAETQQKQAQADCDRADSLMAREAISKQEYDRLKTSCSSQVFSAEAAKANAELAQKQLGDTTIRAPFDGEIGERYVNVGEYTQPQTRVASIVRVRPVRVQISVPESAVPLVKQGQTLNVRVAAYGERDFPATVKYVAPSLRAQTRDLVVEALAPNTDGSLKPGMFATVQLLIGEEELPTVPGDAVRTDPDGVTKRIFIARSGQAWEMVVRTGASRDGRTAIMEPLNGDEKVIVKPAPTLRDGTAIEVK
jgi:membrane fusion protein (multidrug efflux system)